MSAVALTVATVAVGAVGAYTSYKTGQRANDLAEANMIRQQGVEAAKLQTQREELRKMRSKKIYIERWNLQIHTPKIYMRI